MTAANNPQVQPSTVTPPPLSGDSPLQKLIKQWEKEGVTLELIIAMIMSNPEGVGAMDVVSDSISGITQQSNILSKVQTDIITLNSILSKIESQLGNAKTISQKTWDSFSKTLLKQFQTTYDKLFVSDSSNPLVHPSDPNSAHYSDIAYLSTMKAKFPSLDPVVGGIEAWQKTFQIELGGNSSGTFEHDLEHWDPKNTNPPGSAGAAPFINDISYLASEHWKAHQPDNNGGSAGTDYLQNWWQNGNSGQQLASEQSQQDTTSVQSFMQLLQGFDSSAQQDIQLASTQKNQIIQNQKAS